MSNDNITLEAGKILVATPGMADETFAGSVILTLGYSRELFLGVILNKPADPLWTQDISDSLCGTFSDEAGDNLYDLAWFGGPESIQTLTLIHDCIEDCPLSKRIGYTGLGSVDPGRQTPVTADNKKLVYGLVEINGDAVADEILCGAWHVIDADHELLFQTDPENMWEKALAIAGVDKDKFQKPVPQAAQNRKTPYMN